MRIELGYPAAEQEKTLLAGEDRRVLLARLQAALSSADLLELQERAERIHASRDIIDYCYRVLDFTRRSQRFLHGLSPRAGVGLLRSARAWALLAGRDFVVPEDVQAVIPACVAHRLLTGDDNGPTGHAAIAEHVLNGVPVP
jgi:MoxR-like ATPase